MSARTPDAPLDRLISLHYARLRWALGLRHGLRAAGRVTALVALAVALGVAVPPGETFAWTRLVLAAGAGAAALALAVAAFLRERPSRDGYLERVEERFPAVRSWLRNALDFERRPPAHTSLELARALARETARRLAAVPLAALRPALDARRSATAFAAAFAVVAALGFVLPARTERSWRTLLDPSAAAPPVRLEVEPGSVTVTPGVALAVRARVQGTAARPRLQRAELPSGAGPRPAAADLRGTAEGEGRAGERLWRFDLAQITRGFDYRVRVAAVASPRYRVTLAGTPQPVSFEIEIHPPAYARLPAQRGAATRGDIAALRGSRADVEVLFDRDLSTLEVAAPGAAPRAWRAVTPRRWRGGLDVRQDGEYELRARAPGGAGRFRYRIQPIADAPPILAVRLPEGDMDLPAGQQVAYDVMGQDDLGLTELRLQVRRSPDEPWTDRTLARFPGEPREIQVGARWDAGGLGLLPGQSASFRFALFDDDALDGRGVAVSPIYELRFPSLAELYRGIEQRQTSVQDALEQAADRTQELQKSLDQLARQQPAPAAGSPRSFERQQEVRSAVDRQQELSRRIEEASGRLRESLEQAAERRAFDEQLTRRLRELAEIMSQVESPELKEAMRRLAETLENRPQSPPEPGLRDWRRQNEQLLKNLERALELLKQLRQEERLQALAQRAAELKDRQDERNRDLEATPDRPRAPAPDARAQEQERAAGESEQLARDAKRIETETNGPARLALEQAAQELERQAAPAQREAARALAQGRPAQASPPGRRASQSLQRAAQALGDLATGLGEERQQTDLSAMRRAAQDLVSLQRAAESGLGSSAPAQERSDQQADLSEGAARLADSLWALARRSPFVTPDLAAALGRAIEGLQRSGRRYGQGDRAGGEEDGRSAAGALVEAVLELRRSEASSCRNPGQSRPGGSGSMGMDQLGQRQAELNERTRTLSRRLSERMHQAAGDEDELRGLAADQARLREELQRIQEEDRERRQLLGRLDQTATEMQQVQEAMEQGRWGEEVEQMQQHILSRLLDAQRSVNRQDFEPQRESRPGEDTRRASPPALPADLMRPDERLKLGLLKAQADRYPAQYRAFIEAYLRALDSGSPR